MDRADAVFGVGGILAAAGGAAMIQVAPLIWPERPSVIFVVGVAVLAFGLLAMAFVVFHHFRERRTAMNDRIAPSKKLVGVYVGPQASGTQVHDNHIENMDTGIHVEADKASIIGNTVIGGETGIKLGEG